MTPQCKPAGLKKTKLWEYGVRFAFGGLVTAGAGLVADGYGPELGGFMLAFPAILPASLTLIKQHDGRAKAVDDARGARLGSLALAIFGVTVGYSATSWPPVAALGLATLAWIVVAVALWAIAYGGGSAVAHRLNH